MTAPVDAVEEGPGNVSKKQTDVLIIGGGLIGLATAINLLNLKSGVSVTVVEKDDGVA